METASLSSTGEKVSRLAMGGCPLGGHGWGYVNDAEATAAVRRALDLGINLFDTADVYGLGHSEEILSLALAEKRHDAIIATKFGVRHENGRTWNDTRPKYLRTALEASLRRLRIDCIPLYYIHWPDDKTPIGDTMVELERCRREGKIRWIGLSNFSADQLREAVVYTPVQAIQVQYSLVDRHKAEELSPAAKELNTTLISWGSLAQGLLTGKYNARSKFPMNDRRRRYDNFHGDKFANNLRIVETLREVANLVEKTPAQVALRWLLDTHCVGSVLFGAKRPEQVDENLMAANWNLPKNEYDKLTKCTEALKEQNRDASIHV